MFYLTYQSNWINFLKSNINGWLIKANCNFDQNKVKKKSLLLFCFVNLTKLKCNDSERSVVIDIKKHHEGCCLN